MVAPVQVVDASARQPGGDAFADDVRSGLTRTPKAIPSTWFYDERGSELFQQITQQEAYYPTRCEREILNRHGSDIAAILGGRPAGIFEIGAGDGHKTEILLQRLLAGGLVAEYVPIDICRQAVLELTEKLRDKLNGSSIRLRGIVADYFDAFPLVRQHEQTRKLMLFLGSSIGNFGHRQALRLLRALRRALAPGDLLLIGFDLKKDIRVLLQAYDDPAGITREFNLNLLDRMNRELGGQFARNRFLHHATYNLRLGCMESWLVSREQQQVPIRKLGMDVSFKAWEGVRVERSYKYDLSQIESFAHSCGFQVQRHFFDSRLYFVDSLWKAA
jgi:L-histidine Nalpha-methyltransferase